jgi:hypothetical protein
MIDNKNIMKKVIEEHHVFRDKIELTGGPVSDFEALFALRQAYAGWSQCEPQELAAKHAQLLKTLELVDHGLRLHWEHEENAMQPMLGETMMKAFLLEHHDIARRLENAREVITGEKLRGLGQQELLSRKTAVQDIINHLMQAIEEHSNHEDTIFMMVKKGLEG